MTLPQLWDQRVEQIRPLLLRPRFAVQIRALLNEHMVCPECMNPVHVYAVPRVNGFVLAGRNLTERDHLLDMGYQHYTPNNKRNNGVKSVKDCSLYNPSDPRFNDLTQRSKDPKVQAQIYTVLVSPAVKRFNHAVLAELHRAATGRAMQKEDLALYIRLAQSYFMKHEVFASHPYILPYAVMAEVPSFERQGAYGPYQVKFKENGAQELVFRNSRDQDCVTKVPAFLSFMIKKGPIWRPMDRDRRTFSVSEPAAQALVGWDVRHANTMLISVPKALLGAPRASGRPGFLPGMEGWISLQRRFQAG